MCLSVMLMVLCTVSAIIVFILLAWGCRKRRERLEEREFELQSYERLQNRRFVIRILTMANRDGWELEVYHGQTIVDVKEAISRKMGTPALKLHLTLQDGTEFCDNRTIGDYNLKADDVVELRDV